MLQRIKTTDTVKAFSLARFFNGRTEAAGVFETPFAIVRRLFAATFQGDWAGDVFVLQEHFRFSDGKFEERNWSLRFMRDGRFVSECAETIGQGVGHHTGNRCDHSYRLRLPVGRRSVSLRITETYYLIDDHNLLYRAHLSKWGLPVGTIFAAFRRS